MPAGVHVKPERMHDGLSGGWYLLGVQPVAAQQPVDWSRGHRGKELALGIRPKISIASLPRGGDRSPHFIICCDDYTVKVSGINMAWLRGVARISFSEPGKSFLWLTKIKINPAHVAPALRSLIAASK